MSGLIPERSGESAQQTDVPKATRAITRAPTVLAITTLMANVPLVESESRSLFFCPSATVIAGALE
jgi:hypothetical protein